MKEMTISSLLNERLQKSPYKTVVVEDERTMNWSELKKMSDIAAVEFIELGITRGSHVGIFSVNSLQWIVSYLALTRIGALPVLINYNYKKTELEEILDYADVEYLLYGDGFKNTDFHHLISGVDFTSFEKFADAYNIGIDRLESWESRMDAEIDISAVSLLENKVQTHDDLNLLFTSGTTARVKGVMLSHYQMLNISDIQARFMRWSDSDTVCLPLPFFHCFGLTCGLFAALNVDLKICLTTTRTQPILETIQKHRCTVLNGVPSMYVALMRNEDFDSYDLSSLNSGVVAGARVDEKDFLQISKKCHIPNLQQSYGQTEASPAITFTNYSDPIEKRARTVGRVLPEIELRVFNTCNIGDGPVNPIGEVQVKGFNVMKNGYYNMDNSDDVYTEDGWLKTGDIGYLDEDNNLHITGRVKEMIIKKGENICPYEIEEVLMKHEGMIEVKVIGIPDEFSGEEIVAIYRCKDGCNQEDLCSFLKIYLSDYKIPRYFIRLDKFPLHENGKLNLKKINKIVLNKLTGGEADGIKSTTKTN